VSHVFNYDMPQDPEDYVHRIGRTARAGAEGDAISLGCEDYVQSLPDIEAYIGRSLPRGALTEDMLADITVPARERRRFAGPGGGGRGGSGGSRGSDRGRGGRGGDRRDGRRGGHREAPRREPPSTQTPAAKPEAAPGGQPASPETQAAAEGTAAPKRRRRRRGGAKRRDGQGGAEGRTGAPTGGEPGPSPGAE
jgi:ATP-dependent RNA helicase RhlB